jgi:hypothetical protein
MEGDEILPSTVIEKTHQGIQGFLDQSPSYVALNRDAAQLRLGQDPSKIPEFCAENQRCWSQVVDRAKVDILMHISVGFSGSREQAWIQLYNSESALQTQTVSTVLPRGGGAPLESLEELFHGQASIEVELEPGSTRLQVNGRSKLLRPAPRVRLRGMPPGRHEVIVEGLGLPIRTKIVRLFPGMNAQLPLPPAPKNAIHRPHRWWGAWAGSALFLGGSIAVFAGSGKQAQAWR